MIGLRRLGKIIRVAGKYRLDALLEKDQLPLSARLLLSPCQFYLAQVPEKAAAVNACAKPWKS